MARITTISQGKISRFYAYIPDENGNEPPIPSSVNRFKAPGRYYFHVHGINAHHKAHKRAQAKFKVKSESEYRLFQYWDIRDEKSYKEL